MQFKSTNHWGSIQQCVMIKRSVDGLGQKFLDFLDQALRCHVGMARSLWLHRSGMRCHRHWCWGIFLNSWHGRNSWSLVHLGYQCCRCSRCGLHMLCMAMEVVLLRSSLGQNLQRGSHATWDSVDCFDTCGGTIVAVCLIAVPW